MPLTFTSGAGIKSSFEPRFEPFLELGDATERTFLPARGVPRLFLQPRRDWSSWSQSVILLVFLLAVVFFWGAVGL